MKAEEFVGKWIVSETLSETLSDRLNAPANEAFKVVGYVRGTDWVIVDAHNSGRKGLDMNDFVVEECETYMYAHPDSIAMVL